MKRFLLLLTPLALLVGCAGSPDTLQRNPNYAPVTPERVEVPRPVTGSIFHASNNALLFEDRKARRIGDILTIELTERTNASKQASTDTSKQSTTQIANPTILGQQPRDLPVVGTAMGIAGIDSLETNLGANTREFSGSGQSRQSNSLTGRISVTVVDVYPNGNLLVRGEKILALNQGAESVRISGIVRPADIRADNTVLSTQVADAQITYEGSGALADANSMGWLSRAFNSRFWPF